MNPDTLVGILCVSLGAGGLAVVAMFHRWNKQDLKAAKDQRRREYERRMAMRN